MEFRKMGSKMDQSDKLCHLLLTTQFSYNTSNSECSFSASEHTNRQCFGYGGLGHFISNCPNRNSAPAREQGRDKFKKRGYGRGRLNYTSQEQGQSKSTDSKFGPKHKVSVTSTESGISFVALSTEVNSREEGYFIVDSSATEHLVQKALLEHITQVEPLKSPVTIKVANGSHLTCNSKGVILLKCADRIVKLDALIVERLSHNLSVSKLNSKEITVIFTQSCATIVTNNNFLMEHRARNLFVASFEFAHNNCNLSINSDLWHRRLGH
ncbi:hypothetical protein PR048_017816 [Dryococelus australis]|uniref:Uncharacterized protein n=1 Tax=Dryococelus australis TaxID=614101 RepID=A0ABQ9HAQ7_9NEOP|nr:hypothetical protein PR048_017816 [Dryococelus australis]